MKTRPILFNGAVVQALLEGRKTQTRRVVIPQQSTPKVPPLTMEPWVIDGEQETDDDGVPCWVGTHPDYPTGEKWFSCPYGKAGDRLWVREIWRHYPKESRTAYRADGEEDVTPLLTWRPAIIMPRGFSRITLEITGVRVQHLQDITGDDVIAEGVEFPVGTTSYTAWRDRWEPFRAFWDTINAKRGPAFTWSSNPWVWAITFKQV